MTPADIRKLADDCDYPDWEPRIPATLRALADVAEAAREVTTNLALNEALARLEAIKP